MISSDSIRYSPSHVTIPIMSPTHNSLGELHTINNIPLTINLIISWIYTMNIFIISIHCPNFTHIIHRNPTRSIPHNNSCLKNTIIRITSNRPLNIICSPDITIIRNRYTLSIRSRLSPSNSPI